MNKPTSISIESLSAKELFELANKKLQLEQSQARAAELVRKKEDLLVTHAQALAELDRDLQALQRRREQLVAAQQRELAEIDKAIAEASQAAPATVAAAAPVTAAPVIAAPVTPPSSPSSPSPVAPLASSPVLPPLELPGMRSEPAPVSRGPSEDEFTAAIVEAMKGRTDISDSLLREKLRLKGFQVSNLSKQLDKLVREGVVSSKGGGNYALKKRA